LLAGYQRMVAASTATTARAAASYQGRVNGFSNSYQCSSQCNGHPAVTLRACAPAAGLLTRSVTGASPVAVAATRTCPPPARRGLRLFE